MPEPDIIRVANEHRRALLANERAAASRQVRAYGVAWQRIREQLDALLADIQAARARGEDPRADWLLQQSRLEALQFQVEAELRRFARFAEQTIVDEQRAAVAAAQAHAEEQTRAGLGAPPPSVTFSFNRLPAGAVDDLVGVLSDGSPLRALLDQLGPAASKAARDELLAGLAVGHNPQVIARRIRAALGVNLTRALRIARTETLRAYRTASLRTYQANGDVIKGWVWTAARSTRTCGVCWAMDGTVHKLDEPFASHVNCRCAPRPLTKTWADLGFSDIPETQTTVTAGVDAFDALSNEDKIAILGPAKFEAYQRGDIGLADLVGERDDSRWGPSRYELSLAEALRRARIQEPGTGGGPQGPPVTPPPPTPLDMVRTKEDQIRRNPSESVHAFDPHTGQIMFEKAGQQYEVGLTAAEMAQLKGMIVTHNHPRGLAFADSDPRSFGNSFSADDIRTAARGEVAEMRAVTSKLRFSMKPGSTDWDASYWTQVLEPTYTRHKQAVTDESWRAIGQGQITPEEAEARHFHMIWTRVAAELGLNYTREES